jgi:hypothetical protein
MRDGHRCLARDRQKGRSSGRPFYQPSIHGVGQVEATSIRFIAPKNSALTLSKHSVNQITQISGDFIHPALYATLITICDFLTPIL